MNMKAMFLDMSGDAPARAMWQFNGYSGCGECKEMGMNLDLCPGKKNSRRRCYDTLWGIFSLALYDSL